MTWAVHVTVAYAEPGFEFLAEVTLEPGATVDDAVRASGLRERKALAWSELGYAVFGQRARAETLVGDGDRVEITRPLRAEPGEQRRRRASAKLRR